MTTEEIYNIWRDACDPSWINISYHEKTKWRFFADWMAIKFNIIHVNSL